MSNHPKTQRERFEETARQLECDEDEERFDATVKKVAKAGGKVDLTKKPDSESMGTGDGDEK
jgi:hypothetical protein